MRFRFRAVRALVAISILFLAVFFINDSRASASPAQSGATDGAYLATLCGVPELEVKNENQAAVCVTPQGHAIGLVGDSNLTTTWRTNAYEQQVPKCPTGSKPPVWLRYYDGPNMFAKANFEEISFSMPVTRTALPALHDMQSLWDQMTILQPMPIFSDVAPTYCGFYGAKTLWANGGFNFELTSGNTGFDLGDAPPITPWNSPWQAGFSAVPYDGWTVYPIMALGNGAGGPPAGFAFRTEGSRDDSLAAPDSSVQAKYILDNDKQIVTLELSFNGAKSTYAVPQELFKEKFLPAAIANGDLAADDKQVAQVNDFDWRWQLFTNTLTIQKPTGPNGKPITLNELAQYFPKTSTYRDIRAKVKGYPGFNNTDAFENTLVCAKGFELYGTIVDDRLFTDLGDYSKWLKAEADKTDPRYALWRCIEAIAISREKTCVASGSEKNIPNTPWTVTIGYEDEAYPAQCDVNDPETSAIIAGLRKE
jgi:hypothetical protein